MAANATFVQSEAAKLLRSRFAVAKSSIQQLLAWLTDSHSKVRPHVRSSPAECIRKLARPLAAVWTGLDSFYTHADRDKFLDRFFFAERQANN